MENEERLIALEMKISFQEDLIANLNETVIKHGNHIEELEKKQKVLIEKIRELSAGLEKMPEAEKPPHY